ncbi:MAG: YraN family protein [Desulfobacteraceae bacterium]|nr:YraN family protein [Desulfobacteraceae bacterium]
MTSRGQKIGQSGEKAAAEFLCQKGYTLVEKNYRTPTAEIDIIAKDGDCICFVEVKTRTSIKKGLPKESVHHAKQLKLVSGASFYLKEKKLFNHRVRFDVVEVFLTSITQEIIPDETPRISLIKNAFGTV